MKRNRLAIFLLTFALVIFIGQFIVASATNLDTELVTNGGAEAGSIGGWTDDTGVNRWGASTIYSTWALPAEGNYYFFLYNPSMDSLSGTMSQNITLTDANGLFSNISSGNVSMRFSISMFQKISAGNEIKAILEEYDAVGNLLKTSQIVNTTSSGSMGSYTINTQVQKDTRRFKVILSATLTLGGYAQFDKVSLQLVNASAGSAPVFGSDFPASAETDSGVPYSTNFTISDADPGQLDTLAFSASSTNVNLVSASNIIVSGSGGNRTLTIVPTVNLSGEADITVTASDGTKSAEKTFHFIVHKVISMNTNLVENGNGTNGLASWSGNTVNITPTGNGFSTSDPYSSMSQNMDISKFSPLIDGGETNFLMSAAFPNTYGSVSAQFYTDIACTNAVGSPFYVHGSALSLQQKIPAYAKGVKITFSNNSGSYSYTALVRNISFQIVNDFPKISPISDKTTNLSPLTVPVYAYYTTTNATLTAVSNNQAVLPDADIAVSGTGFNRSLTFTPLANGSATITVTLNDGSRSVSKAFVVTALEPAVVMSVDKPAAGYYAAGAPLDFTVHFSHDIRGGTTSTLPLTIGGSPVSASYLSSTANSITYRYTLTSGNTGAVAIGSTIIDSGSPITDLGGYAANLTISGNTSNVTAIPAPQVSSTASGSVATYGDKITFTATLAYSLPGTVQFKANGIDLGSPANVSGNTASLITDEKPFETGPVSITAVFVPSGADAHFLNLTSSVLTVTIQPKPLSVDGLTATAKTYDGMTTVALTGGTLIGALAGDDVSAVFPASGTVTDKNAGTRSVTYPAIVLNGADKGNYVLTVHPDVSVVISPKPVMASVSVSNKAYDGNTSAVVSCSFAIGDILAGDTVTVTASGAFDTKDAGTGKTVTLIGVTKSGASQGNYDITVPLTGSADIAPAPITVTPSAVSKAYGQSDPSFTYTITSGALIASDTLAGSLARAAGEDVGQYDITQGNLTSGNNPNYLISFTSGVKLTVTTAAPVITVTSSTGSAVYGDTVTFTATVAPSGSGTVPVGSVQFWLGSDKMGSPVSLTGGTATYTTSQTELISGGVSVTADYIPDASEMNYSAQKSAACIMSITKKEITVKADDKTIYVGAALPTAGSLKYTVTGLIGGDALMTLPTLSLPLDAGTGKEASYEITVTGADAGSNYTVKMLSGTLEIVNPPSGSGGAPLEETSIIIVPAAVGNGGHAAISVTAGALSQAAAAALNEAPGGADAVVEIQMQGGEHANTVSLTLPKEGFQILSEQGVDMLKVTTSVGSLVFDADALKGLAQQSVGDVTLTIEPADLSALSEAASAVIGDRPAFDINLTSGGQTLSSFGGGNITVSIPYTLRDGEAPDTIVVFCIDDSGNPIPMIGRYHAETGTVEFTVKHFSQFAVGCNKVSFKDVTEGAWYYNAVTFCAAREIFEGTGNNLFDPDATLTRGQFIVLLMRAYGLAPDTNPVDNFADAGNTYYTGYLAAAKRLGLANGVGNNMVMPDAAMTRQDMCTMICRALRILGQLPQTDSTGTLSDFSDTSLISPYAKESIALLAATGVISGSNGHLDPLGYSTRAQMAQILYLLLSK